MQQSEQKLQLNENRGVHWMVKPHGVKDALEYNLFLHSGDASRKNMGRKQISPYKVALVAHDFLMTSLALVLGSLISGFSFFMNDNPAQFGCFLIISLMMIAFFPTYSLYNYHLIFSVDGHLKRLSNALLWSLLSIGTVFFLYRWEDFFEEPVLLLVVFLIAIGMMLFRGLVLDKTLNLIKSVGLSFVAIGMIVLIGGDEKPFLMTNWLAVPTGLSIAVLLVLTGRYFLVQIVFGNWMRRHFRRQVTIVGSGQDAERITNHIIEQHTPFWVAGNIDLQGLNKLEASVPKECLGALVDLPKIVEQRKIDEIIVTDENIDRRILISLLDYCTTEKLTVWFPPKLMPVIDMKLYIDSFCGLPMIRLCSQKNSWVFNKIKHGLDALITLPLFFLLLPFLLLIGIAIKLTSPGPVFYRAKAVGKNGKQFGMYKFRSMKVNNGNDVHKNYVTKLIKDEIKDEGKEDQSFKIKDDPRITSVGKFIRKFSLDELPQLINVLKGDMSLVGPRPCLPYEFEVYKEWHKKRLSVRPGISGLWQVAGRSAVAFEDMVLLDLYYIYNRSILMDMNVMYETIFAVAGKRGAY